MTPASTSAPIAYVVMVEDPSLGYDSGGPDVARVFLDESLANAYAARYVEPLVAEVRPFEVAAQVPALLKHTMIGFRLGAYHNGSRWWNGDLTPENLHVLVVAHLDADDFDEGQHRHNVPVHVARDDTTGQLAVDGTDEAAVRAAYVQHVTEMIEAAEGAQ